MSPEGWEDVGRVLVVRLDGIGDVVMTGPALRTLRATLPEASITLMASPSGSRIAPLLPWVDDVWTFRAVWQDPWGAAPDDLGADAVLIEELRSRRFDAAVILTRHSQSPWPAAYACWRAGVPLRLGQSRELGGSLLTRWVEPPPDETHQVDRDLHLLESSGFRSAGGELELRVPPELAHTADGVLDALGVPPSAPFVAMAPFAGCAARTYDPSRSAEVARRVSAETGLPVVVLGEEPDRELAEAFLAVTRGYPVASLVGGTSAAEQAAVIGRASLVVTNHDGAMHVADAFRRPIVALFSGTDLPERRRPRSSACAILRRQTACAPCREFECPSAMECLAVPAAEVVAECLRLLGPGQPATGVEAGGVASACAS